MQITGHLQLDVPILLLTPEIEVHTIEITGNSPSIVLKSVLSIATLLNSRLPLFQGSNTSLKYFVVNSTGKSSISL